MLQDLFQILKRALNKITDVVSSFVNDKKRAAKLLGWMMPLFNQLKLTEDEFDKLAGLWASGTKDLNNDELKVGCHWVMNSGSQFMPSLPRFRFKAKGLLDEDEAFLLTNDRYIKDHKAVCYTVYKIKERGVNWITLTLLQQKKEFSAQYKMTCEQVLNGMALPEIDDNHNMIKNNNISRERARELADKYLPLMKAELGLA